jgi:hypothetical protein
MEVSGTTPTTTTDQRAAFLCILACLATATILAVESLTGIPGKDFVGDLYWADVFAGPLRHGVVPEWNRRAAMGHSTTIQQQNLMLFLPTILVSYLNGGDLTSAAKASYTLFHALSVFPFYLLARLYTDRKLAAAMGACLYLISPLHLAEWSFAGHWTIAQAYFWLPLALWLLVRAIREQRLGVSAAAAMAMFLMLWADNERTATAVPLLVAFAGFELWRLRNRWPRGLLHLGIAALIGAGLCAYWTVPALLDLGNFLLMSEAPHKTADGFKLWPSINSFQLYHPLQLFDLLQSEPMRGGLSPIVHIQLGFAQVALAAIALVQLRAERRDRPRARVFWSIVILLVLISMGRNSIAGSSWTLIRLTFPGAATFAVCALLMAVFATLTWLGWRRFGPRAALLFVLGVTAVLFASPFKVLHLVPPYSAMRNPLWFLTVNAPLLLALLSAIALDGLAARAGNAFKLAATLATVVALLQASPYLDPDDQPKVPTALRQSFAMLGGILRSDPVEARYAWYPYIESNAYFGYADTFHAKPALYSWVLWTATRWGGDFVAEAYARLTSAAEALLRAPLGDEAAGHQMGSALQNLADANVKYIVTSDLGFQQLTRSRDLLPVARAGYFFVLRNTLWREDAFVRVEDEAAGGPHTLSYQRPRDEHIVFDVPSGTGGEVLIAESFHPWWHATLDGADLAVHPTARGLIVLTLPSAPEPRARRVGRVDLAFARPRLPFLGILFLAALATALVLLAKEIIACVRQTSAPPKEP